MTKDPEDLLEMAQLMHAKADEDRRDADDLDRQANDLEIEAYTVLDKLYAEEHA